MILVGNRQYDDFRDYITKSQLELSKLQNTLDQMTNAAATFESSLRKANAEKFDLEAQVRELKSHISELIRLYEESRSKQGGEYQVSQLVDRSLGFLEKKVERVDNLIRNPHKLLFVKSKNGSVKR